MRLTKRVQIPARICWDIQTRNGNFVAEGAVVHNSNSRVGYVGDTKVAGSMRTRRKQPVDKAGNPIALDKLEPKHGLYWFPWSIPEVRDLMSRLAEKYIHKLTDCVAVYGEIFGRSVQSFDYGIPKNMGLGYRVFDIAINGKYVDYDTLVTWTSASSVQRVPELYRGPFDFERAKELADGPTKLPGAEHIREGIVIRPVEEGTHPKIGRKVLKVVGIEYSLLSNKTDYKET